MKHKWQILKPREGPTPPGYLSCVIAERDFASKRAAKERAAEIPNAWVEPQPETHPLMHCPRCGIEFLVQMEGRAPVACPDCGGRTILDHPRATCGKKSASHRGVRRSSPPKVCAREPDHKGRCAIYEVIDGITFAFYFTAAKRQ